jgi:hypothetical protein
MGQTPHEVGGLQVWPITQSEADMTEITNRRALELLEDLEAVRSLHATLAAHADGPILAAVHGAWSEATERNMKLVARALVGVIEEAQEPEMAPGELVEMWGK